MGDTADAPETGDTTPSEDAPAPAKADEGFKSEESKQRVLADLKKAREERAALEARLKEIEDQGKSEGEKLTERLTQAEKRAEAAEQRALRLEVAASKGLTAAQAKRLVGATLEELEADADEIIEAFPARSAASPPPSTKPSPSARGGTDPTEAPEPDVQKLVDSIPRV
jgi:hypothetical protein